MLAQFSEVDYHRQKTCLSTKVENKSLVLEKKRTYIDVLICAEEVIVHTHRRLLARGILLRSPPLGAVEDDQHLTSNVVAILLIAVFGKSVVGWDPANDFESQSSQSGGSVQMAMPVTIRIIHSQNTHFPPSTVRRLGILLVLFPLHLQGEPGIYFEPVAFLSGFENLRAHKAATQVFESILRCAILPRGTNNVVVELPALSLHRLGHG